MKLMEAKDVAESIMKKKQMCAHGGIAKCAEGCYAEGGEVSDKEDFLSFDDEESADSIPSKEDMFAYPPEEEDDEMTKKKSILRSVMARSRK